MQEIQTERELFTITTIVAATTTALRMQDNLPQRGTVMRQPKRVQKQRICTLVQAAVNKTI